MFSENTLMLYQRDLQLGQYFVMATGNRSRVAQISHQLFCNIIVIVVQIPRVV